MVFFFVKIKELSLRLLKGAEAQPSVTEEELKYIVESIEQEGVLEEQESDLVQSALDFDEITVQEILTPRVDLVTIDVEDPLDEALEVCSARTSPASPSTGAPSTTSSAFYRCATCSRRSCRRPTPAFPTS